MSNIHKSRRFQSRASPRPQLTPRINFGLAPRRGTWLSPRPSRLCLILEKTASTNKHRSPLASASCSTVRWDWSGIGQAFVRSQDHEITQVRFRVRWTRESRPRRLVAFHQPTPCESLKYLLITCNLKEITINSPVSCRDATYGWEA